MDIKQLSMRNFLTIGHAEMELDGRGLLLIQGENKDDTSAKSNGAGKSSIVDGLCWALYGETAREVSGDGVVNDTVSKDCRVSVILEDGPTGYLVERYRKDKVHKNQLFVWQINDTGPNIDLSKGTDKETQEVLNKIVGCSLDVFVGAIYAGQEKMPDLPGMTDKQLKLLIEEAAGVEELSEAYVEARRLAGIADGEYTVAASALKSLTQRRDALTNELDDAKAQHKIFEDGRKDRARIELAKVKPLQDQVTGAEAAISAYDEPKLVARKTTIEAELASHKTQDAALAALVATEKDAGLKAARFRNTMDHMKAALTKSESMLSQVNSQVGKPCGECGKAYCEDDLAAVKDIRDKGVTNAKTELLEAARGTKKSLAEHEAAAAAVAAFRATMTDVSAAIAELAA
ncbi:MAG: AAA family ATPase, partial [Telluria sp.]